MSRSTIARALEPLAASLWGLFLAWTVLLAVVWVGVVDGAKARTLFDHPQLQSVAAALVQSAVPAWLAFAVVNIHLALSRAEGLATARRWLLLVVGSTLILGLLLKWAGWIFGPNLGFKLGGVRGVPLAWPLLWMVLVAGARELVLWVRPRASHGATAAIGAVLVALSVLNLESLTRPYVWNWWFWYHEPLLSHPIHWLAPVLALAVAGGLGWLMRQTRLAPQALHRSRKPALIFLILNALLLATHLRLAFDPPPLPGIPGIEF
jgi:hypothetical protein